MANNEFSVILEKVGNQPLMTTKILREELGLGLAFAKAMVDKVPTTVITGIDLDKALALRDKLEAIGNIVSIPGMAVKLETPAKIKKAAETKETTVKKSAPSPLYVNVPPNAEFDAIFGVREVKKATAKSKDSAKTTPKAKVDKISAAPNDEFDAIFGKGK